MIRFIQRPETDPYYNLAAEEYIFKTAVADTFMIWRNEPSVIIGKHQNTLKEINSKFLEEHNIPVIRRITGGGTVYHDLGNINFSFIFTHRKENLVDFREFTKPIILFLKELGLNAIFEGKNNITVDGLKVSGNSAHLYKNKVIYHGTLLFDSNLDFLDKAIAGNESNFHDKAVKSVRAKIVNIIQLLNKTLSIEEFVTQFKAFTFNYFEGYYEDKLNDEDQASIRKLAEEKYKSFEWNYGYSPDYEFYNEWFFNDDEYSVNLQVQGGIIKRAILNGPLEKSSTLKNIVMLLQGHFHEKSSMQSILYSFRQESPENSDFLNLFFSKLF